MTMKHQVQSLHYMHMYATLDGLPCTNLQHDAPIGDVMSLPPFAFLPTAEDSKELCRNYAIMLGGLLVLNLPYFAAFKDCTVDHISHRNFEEMQQKSTVVSKLSSNIML